MSQSPSEALSAAADLIRDLAAETSPAPWHATDPYILEVEGSGMASVGVRLADARWIAALSPALAPLLINWLETEAACIASVDDVKRIMPKILDGIESGAGGEDTTVTVTIDTSGAALAFAKAILGSGVESP